MNFDKIKAEIQKNVELNKTNGYAAVGCSFLLDLVSKYTETQKQLSKNLDLYKELNKMDLYDKTFSQWNTHNLFLWDLKDALCRMGIDIE